MAVNPMQYKYNFLECHKQKLWVFTIDRHFENEKILLESDNSKKVLLAFKI